MKLANGPMACSENRDSTAPYWMQPLVNWARTVQEWIFYAWPVGHLAEWMYMSGLEWQTLLTANSHIYCYQKSEIYFVCLNYLQLI